ncbi:MAG: VCBS repeat-containing protein, partial [Planctomycetes bacterium]|nr:VCBS repeat-containing protein [Planctomycetota bacterium]
ATAMVSPSSVLRVADVDGDGIDDIVALIEFEVPSPGDGDALLVLARGNPAAAVDEQPFFEPTVVALAHGKATSFALGDFAAAVPGQPVQLELALAVPEPAVSNGLDGDHVRFYRYVAGPTPAEDHFEPSHAPNGPQVLLAGSKPTRVAADDFDGDGLVDLMVAAAGDASLRLFRNIALPTPTNGGEVEIDAFQEAESSTRALSPGFPTQLRLGDVNGDGTVDVLVAVESTTSTLGTSLAFYVSEEPGLLGEANFVSPSRLGDREAAMALDLGDYNRDSVLDLFIGWDTAINARDRNVRVLFGGSR